jgi:hypothetical protein
MAFAVNLQNAGFLSYEQMYIKYAANTLKSATASFAAAANPIFPDEIANNRPVGNWLILIDALVVSMPTGLVGQKDFNQIVEYVARMCIAGYTINTQTPPMITNSQATALLAAWNAAFGTP